MVKFIHAESKIELAKQIVLTAPVNSSKFQIVKKIPPKGYLVEYGTIGLSLYKLGVELGLVEKKAKPDNTQVGYYHPSAKTLEAMNKGKRGLVLLD